MEIDGSSKDTNNVPSKAEDEGDEANNMENGERMSHPSEPGDYKRNLGESAK